jgi:hypothetical protein
MGKVRGISTDSHTQEARATDRIRSVTGYGTGECH